MSVQAFYEEHKALSIVILIVLLAIVYSLFQHKVNFRLVTTADNSIAQDATVFSMGKGVGGGTLDSFAMEEAAVSRSAGLIAPSPQPPSFFGSGDDIVIEDEKIIKTAFLALEVDSVDQSLNAIENIAKTQGGFVTNSSASEDTEGTRFGSITIKVPVDTFDTARGQIKDAAVFVQNENINARDVTEEFIDIEARLRNLQAQESSYLTLLNRATKIEDIIQITNSLTNVRTQIEQTEGRKRYLEGQTDFSTINVSLSEEREVTLPSRKWRPLAVIQDAARNTVSQFQGFVDNVVEFVFWTIGIIPYLIVIALIFWVFKRFRK